MRSIGLIGMMIGGTLIFPAKAEESGESLRTALNAEQKLEQLLTVMPGAADIMIMMGERYKNVYWAGRHGQWEFAAYQAEEIEGLIKKLIITRPKRAASAREFLGSVYPRLIDTINDHNLDRFVAEVEYLRQQCMACHVKNKHGFIRLPIPNSATSPVLNIK